MNLGPIEENQHLIAGWLGAAVAVVALYSWGQGTLVKRTLQASILFVLLTNVDKFAPLLSQWVASLRMATNSGGSIS